MVPVTYIRIKIHQSDIFHSSQKFGSHDVARK